MVCRPGRPDRRRRLTTGTSWHGRLGHDSDQILTSHGRDARATYDRTDTQRALSHGALGFPEGRPAGLVFQRPGKAQCLGRGRPPIQSASAHALQCRRRPGADRVDLEPGRGSSRIRPRRRTQQRRGIPEPRQRSCRHGAGAVGGELLRRLAAKDRQRQLA